jgi:hypothetical protein
MKLKQMALAVAMLGAGAFGIATSAHALNIDALDLSTDAWVLDTNYWTINGNIAVNAGVVTSETGYIGGALTSIYKMDYPSTEEGMAAHRTTPRRLPWIPNWNPPGHRSCGMARSG